MPQKFKIFISSQFYLGLQQCNRTNQLIFERHRDVQTFLGLRQAFLTCDNVTNPLRTSAWEDTWLWCVFFLHQRSGSWWTCLFCVKSIDSVRKVLNKMKTIINRKYVIHEVLYRVKDTKASSSPNEWLSFKFVVPRFLLVKCVHRSICPFHN